MSDNKEWQSGEVRIFVDALLQLAKAKIPYDFFISKML